MKDYYKVLGVEKVASDDEIKRAYSTLAHQFHPDKKGGSADKFKEINEAYQVLSNKEKRANYDRFGQAEPFGANGGRSPFEGAGGFGGFDFSNFNVNFDGGEIDLGDIFEGFFSGASGGRRKRYESGADLEILETISLEESFTGTSKTLRYETFKNCDTCAGVGFDASKGVKSCQVCAGKGEIREMRKTFFGQFSQVKQCPDCRGAGEKANEECKECKGAGRKKHTREFNVEIAKGIRDGQIIQVKGLGEAGVRKANAGDLYVKIRIKPHPVFIREGDDLYMKVVLPLAQVFSQEPLEIMGIDKSKLKIELTPGIKLEEKYELRGEGMPRLHSFGRGSLYINFSLPIPKKINDKVRKLGQEIKIELGS